jgi:hypothetical protein
MYITPFGFVYSLPTKDLEYQCEEISECDILIKVKVVDKLITIWSRLHWYIDMNNIGFIADKLKFPELEIKKIYVAKKSITDYDKKEMIRKEAMTSTKSKSKSKYDESQLSLF